VTLGGMFDFHEQNLKEGIKNINIPEMSLNNVSISGQIIIDKETLGFKEINPILTVDLIENLDNLKDILGI
ncbi:MAG: hypothetical protein MUO82_07465, partial [Candidatus Thermoplasmatota archaeon]|nr:hypothetical protein [Candidatus Thermoplasmatota archaeon]